MIEVKWDPQTQGYLVGHAHAGTDCYDEECPQNKRPIRIGLDVDGVIYNWGKTVRTILGSRYAIEIPEDEWFSKDHVNNWVWKWLWSDVGVQALYSHGEYFRGAKQFVDDLMELGEVHIITATPENARRHRIDWLYRNDIQYTDIHWAHADFNSDVDLSRIKKSSIEPQCDIYIEDNVYNCVELANNTNARLVILLDREWNRGPESESLMSGIPQIYRAADFEEVVELIEFCYTEAPENEERTIKTSGLEGSVSREAIHEAIAAAKEKNEQETVAEEAYRLVHGPREDQYGHPHANMTATADLVTAYLRTRYFGVKVEDLELKEDDAAVMMLLMKIARYAAGRHTRDTVVDMAGYAAVLGRVLGLDR